MTLLEFQEELQGQADWRREKAAQYPDDKRNAAAAEIFDRLAATAPAIPHDVYAAFLELFEARDSEEYLQMLQSVGFRYWPASAEQFVRDFIASRSGTTSWS